MKQGYLSTSNMCCDNLVSSQNYVLRFVSHLKLFDRWNILNRTESMPFYFVVKPVRPTQLTCMHMPYQSYPWYFPLNDETNLWKSDNSKICNNLFLKSCLQFSDIQNANWYCMHLKEVLLFQGTSEGVVEFMNRNNNHFSLTRKSFDFYFGLSSPYMFFHTLTMDSETKFSLCFYAYNMMLPPCNGMGSSQTF